MSTAIAGGGLGAAAELKVALVDVFGEEPMACFWKSCDRGLAAWSRSPIISPDRWMDALGQICVDLNCMKNGREENNLINGLCCIGKAPTMYRSVNNFLSSIQSFCSTLNAVS